VSRTSKVLPYRDAVRQGFERRRYAFGAGKVPVGRVQAVLDWKIWGQLVMGIGCYFTSVERGEKFVVTVYWERATGGYCIRGCAVDIVTCPTGAVYEVETRENGLGNPVIKAIVGPVAQSSQEGEQL